MHAFLKLADDNPGTYPISLDVHADNAAMMDRLATAHLAAVTIIPHPSDPALQLATFTKEA